MWQRSDIKEGKLYQVALCQSPSGSRSFALYLHGSKNTPQDVVFLTEAVPTKFLVQRDFGEISETILLTSGKRFVVDAHGTWLTQEELEALEGEDDEAVVPWVNGLPPNFAPK